MSLEPLINFEVIKWFMYFVYAALFYFGVVNFNKHRHLKRGLHDKQIQEFVDSSIPHKNIFKKKSIFYFSLCTIVWVLVFVYGEYVFNRAAKIIEIHDGEVISRDPTAKVIEIRGRKIVSVDGDILNISGDVFTPNTRVSSVWVGYPDGILNESWSIQNVGDQILIKQGIGSYEHEICKIKSCYLLVYNRGNG